MPNETEPKADAAKVDKAVSSTPQNVKSWGETILSLGTQAYASYINKDAFAELSVIEKQLAIEKAKQKAKSDNVKRWALIGVLLALLAVMGFLIIKRR